MEQQEKTLCNYRTGVTISTGMILFEWDEAKAESNQRKHGISFEEAKFVFADPYALAEQDRIEGGELRWQTIGLVGGVVLLLVAHAVREPGRDYAPHFSPTRQPEGANAL
jgi:uncharacterized DUF497 family protein